MNMRALAPSSPLRTFDDFFSAMRPETALSDRPVPLTIREDASTIWVDADLPGVPMDAVDITLDKNLLTIRAARTLQVPEGQELRHQERASTDVTRTIKLASPVQAEAVSAAMRDGVLTVTLPKSPESKGRKIVVNQA